MAGSWRFEAIGTVWTIDTEANLTPATQQAVTACIDEFDQAWSRFRPDSLVSIARESGAPVDVPASSARLRDLFQQLAEVTDGALSAAVGGQLEALGYDTEYSLGRTPSVDAPLRTDLGTIVRWDDRILQVAPGTLLDVGAVGKGLLVDLVATVLFKHGHRSYTVDAGGDLAIAGRTERVALEDPSDPSLAIGVIEVRDRAIAASATNRRRWTTADGREVHHVLDARTGLPVTDVLATWAIAPDAASADALASALFFCSAIELPQRWGRDVECARLLPGNLIEYSPGFREAWLL